MQKMITLGEKVFDNVTPKTRISFTNQENDHNYRSIMKKHSKKNMRVSFADEIEDLVCVKEFCSTFWKGVQAYNVHEIIRAYRTVCCQKEIPIVNLILEQLLMVKNNEDYTSTLNLYGVCVTSEILDTFETVFRMVTFQSIYIYINNLCKATAIDLFEMISFYDPTKELVLCDSPASYDLFIWDIVSNTIKECSTLNSICFRQLNIEDHSFGIFLNTINTKSNILTLHFVGCKVGTAPNFNLAYYLDENNFLEEIHLCYTNLCHKEADVLGKYIAKNNVLKVLDLSNNKLGDRGVDALAKGLCEQAYRGAGIETLVLIDNLITRCSALTLCNIIANCPLKAIDLGWNNLSDVVLIAIKDDVADSKTLRSLGLQSTFISCSGLFYLIEACIRNKHLQHLNLRGNKRIQLESLTGLAESIHFTNLTRIELDNMNRSCNVSQQYIDAINHLHNSVETNKLRLLLLTSTDSLTVCTHKYVPDLSYCAFGPHTRSMSPGRFQVVAVPECISSIPLRRYHSTMQTGVLNNLDNSGSSICVKVSTKQHISECNEICVPHSPECGVLPKETTQKSDFSKFTTFFRN